MAKTKVPKPRPKPKKKKSTMKEQQPSLVRNHYAGLGLATGIAGYAATSAIQEGMSNKDRRGRRQPLRGDRKSYEQKVAQRSAESAQRVKNIKAEEARYRLTRMQGLNPNHLNDGDKKLRNQIIKQSKKTIADAAPPAKIIKTVSKVAGPLGVALTILDYLQGSPAGEGSAYHGPGARKK